MSREDVKNWFEDSTLSRMMERRTRGVTADWLLGELVRRPGEANRNSATSLTRREGEPGDTAPGEGEWHGGRHRIQETDNRTDPAYMQHYGIREERAREFQEAMDEADFCPACVYDAGLQAAVDDQLCFRDRRYDGRRYRETDNDALLDGPQEPYPHPGPIDESGFLGF